MKQKPLSAGNINPAILIKLCSNVQPGTINQPFLDSLTDYQTDRNSPIVKSFRTNNAGLLILSFENEVKRDDALCRIRSKSNVTEGIFSSVFIPPKAYPFIVKFSNVDLNLFPTTPSENNKAKAKSLASSLELDNTLPADSIVSLSVIAVFKETNSCHVRISLIDEKLRDDVLKRLKFFTGEVAHRMKKIDLNKEVKRCKDGCQLYGHRTFECKTKLTNCGKCGANHTTTSCTSSTKCCFHCREAHHAGDPSCPAQIKAVRILAKHR